MSLFFSLLAQKLARFLISLASNTTTMIVSPVALSKVASFPLRSAVFSLLWQGIKFSLCLSGHEKSHSRAVSCKRMAAGSSSDFSQSVNGPDLPRETAARIESIS